MLRVPLKKGDFYETQIAYRLALIHSTCSSNLHSMKLPMQTQQLHHLASRTVFSNTITSHRKTRGSPSSSFIETEQRYLCRVLHFNRQNLMLVSPSNDSASEGQILLTYGLFYKNVATSGSLPLK